MDGFYAFWGLGLYHTTLIFKHWGNLPNISHQALSCMRLHLESSFIVVWLWRMRFRPHQSRVLMVKIPREVLDMVFRPKMGRGRKGPRKGRGRRRRIGKEGKDGMGTRTKKERTLWSLDLKVKNLSCEIESSPACHYHRWTHIGAHRWMMNRLNTIQVHLPYNDRLRRITAVHINEGENHWW